VGKISGAVGTYTALTPEVERLALERLGLEVDPISSQIIQRDRYAAYFTTLAVAAGGVERLCVELRHLQRTEVREVEEGFGKGQKGSSAMPHKKNPISAENMTGLTRLIRGNSLAAMENMALWHERDISHSSVERVIMPDSTILMDYVLARLNGLLGDLRVIPENMEHNLMGSYGLFFSQRVLLALIEEAGLSRQTAYGRVQTLAMQSWAEKRSFPDLVRQDAFMREHLSGERMDVIFDPASCLRYEDSIFERVFSS
jgi:adenylosuccinate lyase